MNPVPPHIKSVGLLRQFELSRPLLPEGAQAALWLGGRCLIATADSGQALASGSLCFPLLLDGAALGEVRVAAPADAAGAFRARAWGESAAHAMQAMIDAMHTRRSVAREALDTYRELALLQRAVHDLNHSLDPAAVAAALLKEFSGQSAGARYGAVFLRPEVDEPPVLIESFGENSVRAFADFARGPRFAAMLAAVAGDIVDDLAAAGDTDGACGFRSLLWQPLTVGDAHLGLLVLAAGAPGMFSAADMKRAHTLASVAATALRNAQLYAAEQAMFQSFVRVIATAIDAKSPYTAGHCRRVPEIALMLADSAHRVQHGPLAAFTLADNERQAMEIAAMLHDCGKVVTPEWVVDKATRLDAIVNRLDLIALRFEILRRDVRAAGLQPDEQAARLRQLDDDFAFVERCNRGEEFVSAEHRARLHTLAAVSWCDDTGKSHPLLTANELHNLATPRGTLNPQERKIIEDHAVHTANMLAQIAFPRSLRNVTEYAASHHERVDGKGYPRGLQGEAFSIPARIIAIADIFEALTAPDRPYRKGGSLDRALDIMRGMKEEGHIDGDLFDLFIAEEIFLTYARRHLPAAQIDVDHHEQRP